MGFVYPTDEVTVGGEKSTYQFHGGSGLGFLVDSEILSPPTGFPLGAPEATEIPDQCQKGH